MERRPNRNLIHGEQWTFVKHPGDLIIGGVELFEAQIRIFAIVQAQPTPRWSHGDNLGHRLAVAPDDDLLALFDAGEQPRQLRLRVEHVHDLHSSSVISQAELVKLDEPLRDKDRVEIYRPLIADPKEVRRKRAEEGKVTKKGGGDVPSEKAPEAGTSEAA